MDTVEIEGLEACYRAYQADNGVLVRVKVTVKDAAKGAYLITGQAIDESGEPLGPETSPHCLTAQFDQTDIPEIVDAAENAKKGDMAVIDGRLMAHDGEGLKDHGPAPEGVTPAVAEMLVTWDRAARRVADQTAKAWKRQEIESDILQLIGGSDD